MSIKCPLWCFADSLIEKEFVSRESLIKLNKKLLGINVDHLIRNDLKYYECKKCGLGFFYPNVVGDKEYCGMLQNYNWYYQEEKEEYKIAAKYVGKKEKVFGMDNT